MSLYATKASLTALSKVESSIHSFKYSIFIHTVNLIIQDKKLVIRKQKEQFYKGCVRQVLYTELGYMEAKIGDAMKRSYASKNGDKWLAASASKWPTSILVGPFGPMRDHV